MNWQTASEVLYINVTRQLGQGELQTSDRGTLVSLTAICVLSSMLRDALVVIGFGVKLKAAMLASTMLR